MRSRNEWTKAFHCNVDTSLLYVHTVDVVLSCVLLSFIYVRFLERARSSGYRTEARAERTRAAARTWRKYFPTRQEAPFYLTSSLFISKLFRMLSFCVAQWLMHFHRMRLVACVLINLLVIPYAMIATVPALMMLLRLETTFEHSVYKASDRRLRNYSLAVLAVFCFRSFMLLNLVGDFLSVPVSTAVVAVDWVLIATVDLSLTREFTSRLTQMAATRQSHRHVLAWSKEESGKRHTTSELAHVSDRQLMRLATKQTTLSWQYCVVVMWYAPMNIVRIWASQCWCLAPSTLAAVLVINVVNVVLPLCCALTFAHMQEDYNVLCHKCGASTMQFTMSRLKSRAIKKHPRAISRATVGTFADAIHDTAAEQIAMAESPLGRGPLPTCMPPPAKLE